MRKSIQAALAPASAIILGILFGSPSANAQREAMPDVPKAIQAPAGEQVLLHVHGVGSQVYTCQAGTDGFMWTLKAPEAELRDQHDQVVGSHFAGPAWKLKDGSEVTGKAVGHVDSPDAGSIPWLLVNVVSHSGKGLLTNVTSIQRVNTHGGKPPAEGCNDSHHDAETKSPYTADYYFFAPAK